jgi:hypothetical protein
MLKRFALLCSFLALPCTSQAMLLGNHQLTLDILGTTEYFEFADFLEYEFPVQGLDWGFRFFDYGDIENLDPNLPLDDPRQNRNRIQMHFEGNLDIGLRLRSALSPRFGLETYIKYSPVDLVLIYNDQPLPEANFSRYSGVQNPDDQFAQWIWVNGDYPTYHVVRFGANLDYTFYRSPANTVNGYVSAGAGIVSYFRGGELIVPTDFDEDGQDIPTAPENISFYMPNDRFISASFGFGGIVFLHRLFGLNLDLRASNSHFELKRTDFEGQSHWILSASIGYTIRFG